MRLLRRDPWSLEGITPPWGELKSIYQQFREGILDPLPDEAGVAKKSGLSWVGGAMDGVFGHHVRAENKQTRIFEIVSAVQSLQQKATTEALRKLYELLFDEPIVNCIDSVLEQLTNKSSSINESRLLAIGRYFATRAGHREVVKFGLALMGVFGTRNDTEIMETLGKSDEFALFGAVGLARLSNYPERALWDLARNVKGWGRIQIVERLKDTSDREIQNWMLREGFQNEIMHEYLACICARTGRLHEVLHQKQVDAQLLDGAAGIISALVPGGGPAEGIDDYDHAAEACENYLNIVWTRSDLSLKHFLAVAKLRIFLSEPDGWEKRYCSGWMELGRQTMQSLSSDIIRREDWRRRIESALGNADEGEFYEGDEAAQVLSMDTWSIHFLRVKTAPLTSQSWYRLMQQTDENRIDQVLAFAESILPFGEIETGPSDELGLGPSFRAHATLDWLLQDLKRFPGRGWRLIRAGLSSPVVRNRNMAIRALAAWPLETWTGEMHSFVRDVYDIEPQERVRKSLEKLLAGGSSEGDDF